MSSNIRPQAVVPRTVLELVAALGGAAAIKRRLPAVSLQAIGHWCRQGRNGGIPARHWFSIRAIAAERDPTLVVDPSLFTFSWVDDPDQGPSEERGHEAA